jgi:hypothetical protein
MESAFAAARRPTSIYAAVCSIAALERSHAALSYTPTQQRPSCSPGSSPLLDEVRIVMRLGHISRPTEDSHLHYVSDFIRFHDHVAGMPTTTATGRHAASQAPTASSATSTSAKAPTKRTKRKFRSSCPRETRSRAERFNSQSWPDALWLDVYERLTCLKRFGRKPSIFGRESALATLSTSATVTSAPAQIVPP